MPKSKYKKRADGRYLAQVKTGRFDENGKEILKNIYGRTGPELEKNIRDFRSLLDKGIIVDDKKMTFKEWAQIWLNTYKADVSARTRDLYETVLRLHCGLIDDIQLSKVRPDQIQQLVNGLAETRRTQERTLMVVKSVFVRAIKNELIYKSPAEDISLVKKVKMEKRALTDAERADVEALFPKLPPIIRIFVAVMLYCGLRRGEVWALTRNDINLENKTLNVNKTAYIEKVKAKLAEGSTEEQKAKYKHIVKVGPPKTQASIRSIPMPQKLIDILTPYIKTNDHLLLIHATDGQLLTECQINKLWTRFLKKYNRSKGGTQAIKAIAVDITPHMLRHTYATMLYYAGVDVKTAQYLLGHTDIRTTLAIYTHLKKGKDAEAIQKLNVFLNSQQTVKNQSNE